ncbi:MAG: LPS export ABC transporter periplasmic protein LptC [Exilibacterium sp.]
MPRNWFSLLALVALIFVFLILWESPPTRFLTESPETEATDKYPSAFMSGAQIIQYDVNGKVNYRFNADKLSYYQQNPAKQSDGDYTDINLPNIVLYSKEEAHPWHIKANYGYAKMAGDMVTFKENVRLWRKDSDNRTSELTTEKLVVNPQAQFAETNKPVIIIVPDGETRAVGMKADLKQDQIELLSQVRGVHEPTQETSP